MLGLSVACLAYTFYYGVRLFVFENLPEQVAVAKIRQEEKEKADNVAGASSET